MPAKFVKLNLATGMQVAAQSDVADLAASTSAALGVGSLELGHASDTTLSRSAAGVLAVEGNHVPAPASQAQGDVLYHNGTTWARLAAGTSGHFLKTNGAGANPAWAAASGGTSPMVLIASATASNSATIDFTTASIFNGTYNTIKVYVNGLCPVDNAVALMMRISQSGSWKSDGGYHIAGRNFGTVSGSTGSVSSTAASSMGMFYSAGGVYHSSLGNASNQDAVYEYTFGGNYGTSGKTRLFRCHGGHRHYNTGITIQHWTGSYFTNTNAIDGIRFLFESGNISTGTFYVYGIS